MFRKKRECSISHMGGNKYLLKGTPDQEAIENLVVGQGNPYIMITVENGNIRDLPGGILPHNNGYLVFKKLFEVNIRPAMYLLPDIAGELRTAPKNSAVSVDGGKVTKAHLEFNLTGSGEPVGYISLPRGKTLLYRLPAYAAPSAPEVAASHAAAVPDSPSVAASAPTPSEPLTDSKDTTPNKMLSIICAIADDERNLTLIKDIAYTAYSIITTVKKSGAASKEQVAACVVAALAAPETRSALRRIGSDVFRRFSELNKEAGSPVNVKPGYRILPNNEVALDEYPDAEMIAAIHAEIKHETIKAHLNYDKTLGCPDNMVLCDSGCGYIVKNTFALSVVRDYSIYTLREAHQNSRAVYAAQKGDIFFAAIQDETKILHVFTTPADGELFGCYKPAGEGNLRALYIDEVVAERMDVCHEVFSVTRESVEDILIALPGKVIHVISPHPSDTKALVRGGYKVGTEKKGDNWVLWGFPEGKTLNVPGLPKSIVGGTPQY
jgi:hypothetical protein